jgi:hypothetical protein
VSELAKKLDSVERDPTVLLRGDRLGAVILRAFADFEPLARKTQLSDGQKEESLKDDGVKLKRLTDNSLVSIIDFRVPGRDADFIGFNPIQNRWIHLDEAPGNHHQFEPLQPATINDLVTRIENFQPPA